MLLLTSNLLCCAVLQDVDGGPAGSEYMASSIVRGCPDECLSVLVDLSSNTTILGPASKIELLEDGEERQVRGQGVLLSSRVASCVRILQCCALECALPAPARPQGMPATNNAHMMQCEGPCVFWCACRSCGWSWRLLGWHAACVPPGRSLLNACSNGKACTFSRRADALASVCMSRLIQQYACIFCVLTGGCVLCWLLARRRVPLHQCSY
jgi:hypothetical protein